MITRSEIVDTGTELAEEFCPDSSYLSIHMRGILEEFTRKLATRVNDRLQKKVDPKDCPACGRG